MPIFELDDSRPRLVQPMQPLPGSFASDCAALLTDHLAAVAGEPLFVVRSRAATHEHADVPEVLALDATGRPVIVEVVQVADDDAVVAALRHAGSASRMTTTDLARAYHADPSRFPVDFAAFREQVAFGATTSRREGARLIVLCSEVAVEAGDTLGFLRGPGRHVEVLQVGVVRGADDRRLLDVSPLATHETVRRSVEPTALRLVRSSEAFATAMAYDPGRATNPPAPPAPAVPAEAQRPPAAADLAQAPPVPVRVPVAGLAAAARAAADKPTPVTGVALLGSTAVRPPVVPTPPVVPAPSAGPASSAAPLSSPGPASFVPADRAEPGPSGEPSRPSDLAPQGDAPPTERPLDDDSRAPVARLGVLARQRRSATVLVWLRERRNQKLLATLRRDGLIQLADGRVFADPDDAAAAAAGALVRVDGWRAWRLGDGGLTLAEAAGLPQR